MQNHLFFEHCEEVYFSNGVEEILAGFAKMPIKKLFIPRSVKVIHLEAFQWSKIEEIWLDRENQHFSIDNDSFASSDRKTIYWSEAKTICLSKDIKIGYLKRKCEITFDETVLEYQSKPMDNLDTLIVQKATNLTIPATMKYFAFQSYYKEIEITIDQGNPSYLQTGFLIFERLKYQRYLAESSRFNYEKLINHIRSLEKKLYLNDEDLKSLHHAKLYRAGMDYKVSIPLHFLDVCHVNPNLVVNDINDLYQIALYRKLLFKDKHKVEIIKGVFDEYHSFIEDFIVKPKWGERFEIITDLMGSKEFVILHISRSKAF